MRSQLEGSQAVARAVARRPEVISAYPISPQTHIVEGLSTSSAPASLAPCEYLMVESEFAAMSRRSAPPRPARAHTRRRRARASSTWSRPSTTPPGSACRS